MKYMLCITICLSVATTAPALQSGNLTYTINSADTNTVTITGCTSSTNTIGIPSAISGKSVTDIGMYAFSWNHDIVSVSIPDSVKTIGHGAFSSCINLSDVQLGNGLQTIDYTAFRACTGLTSIAIPSSVTTIREEAFELCDNLTAVYFKGNRPIVWTDAFNVPGPLAVYYLPRTAYWTSTVGGWPITPWNMQILSPNELNQFGFSFPGPDNMTVIVEACTNLIGATWTPIQTNTIKNGSAEFRDPNTSNYPARHYRILMP